MSDPILPFPAPDPAPRDAGAEAAEAAAEAAFAAEVAAAYQAVPGPAPDAATRCAAAVLARAQGPGQPWFRRRWWWGGAAAAALLLMTTLRQDRRHGENALLLPPPPVAEPGLQLTRFAVTLPPGARSVTLVGDFNGWDAAATPMRRAGGEGAWSASIPLPPGRHVYAFVVDGREWRVDPLAPQVPDEGLGPANAVIVDGPR